MGRPQVEGEVRIERGCTPGWVDLCRTTSGIYILTLAAETNPENRWLPKFTQAINVAFEAIEWHLEHEAGQTPAALLTVSASPKFFSNGIDPDGRYAKSLDMDTNSPADHAELALMMAAFIRPLQLPIPTICAVGGHAFGAGMMFAAGHDYRLQRQDRGYMCAVEIEIGAGIPPPEMALFKHIMSEPAFYQTVMGAKRWGAADALKEGLIVKASAAEDLFSDALSFAEEHARFARTAGRRLLYRSIKHQAKGHVSRMVMEYIFHKGELPRAISTCPEAAERFDERYAYLKRHIGEEIDPLPNGQLMGALLADAQKAKL